MKRLPGWEQALLKIIQEQGGTPFEWGTHDCCLFSAACIDAMTGTNPMTDFIGQYRDRKSGLLALKKFGKGSLLKTLVALFGPWKHPSLAQRGDLVLRVERTGSSVGICLGKDSAFVGEEAENQGLVFLPTLSTTKAFSI